MLVGWEGCSEAEVTARGGVCRAATAPSCILGHRKWWPRDREAVEQQGKAQHIWDGESTHLPFPSNTLTPRHSGRTWGSLHCISQILTGHHRPHPQACFLTDQMLNSSEKEAISTSCLLLFHSQNQKLDVHPNLNSPYRTVSGLEEMQSAGTWGRLPLVHVCFNPAEQLRQVRAALPAPSW